MNKDLKKQILKEIKNILEQVDTSAQAEEASTNVVNTGLAATAGGIAGFALGGPIGMAAGAALAGWATNAFSNMPQMVDAIKRAGQDPKAFVDFIKSQMQSNVIDDKESEAMVGLARVYDQYCKNSDKNWCRKVIKLMPDYKYYINNNWTTILTKQKSDKLEIIRLMDGWSAWGDEEVKPTPTPEPTPTPPEPDNGGGKGKGGKGKKCVRCKNVKKGCKGSVVKEIHDKLVALKLIPATSKEVTSQTFGAETEKVIRDFQTAKKIKLDGVVGKDTSKALGISCGKVDDKGNTEDTTPKCKDGTPAPGGDVSKCPPDSKPEPKPEPETGGMTEFQALRTARKMMDRNMSDIAQRLVSFFIGSGKTPQQAYDKVSGLLGPDGRKFWDVNDAFGPGSSKEINDKAKAFRRGLEDTTGKTYSEILKLPLKGISKESKQFKYENYYDSKKEKEANILFERLVKKL